jgi:nucleoside-diphosphate-sugar epimerase
MGATGNVGGALVELLRARDVRVHAITREARAWPEGVQGLVGDANDPASLAGAAVGMDGAFLMSGYESELQLLSDLCALGARHCSRQARSRSPTGATRWPPTTATPRKRSRPRTQREQLGRR